MPLGCAWLIGRIKDATWMRSAIGLGPVEEAWTWDLWIKDTDSQLTGLSDFVYPRYWICGLYHKKTPNALISFHACNGQIRRDVQLYILTGSRWWLASIKRWAGGESKDATWRRISLKLDEVEVISFLFFVTLLSHILLKIYTGIHVVYTLFYINTLFHISTFVHAVSWQIEKESVFLIVNMDSFVFK